MTTEKNHAALKSMLFLAGVMACHDFKIIAESVKYFASAWKALMDAMEVSRKAAIGED